MAGKALQQLHGIAFEEQNNADRGVVPWYDTMIANDTQRPLIVYNAEQNLYYFLRGPRQTPGKRRYPMRAIGGLPIESQPETYYSTAQAVDIARILSITDPHTVLVSSDGMVGWPSNPPYYLYLAQKVALEEFDTYRYVKAFDGEAKARVTAVDGNTLTINLPLTLDDVSTQVYYLVFFEDTRLIDDLIDSPLILFAGDETFRDVTLGDAVPIVDMYDHKNLTITVTSTYQPVDHFVGSDLSAIPSVGDKFLVLTRADNSTIVNYEEVEVTQIQSYGDPVETLVYENDPSFVVDSEGLFIPSPLEGAPIDFGEIDDTDPDSEPTVIGKLVAQQYNIRLKEDCSSMDIGDEFVAFTYTELSTSDISDAELSIPLPGTEWSLQPHTFHMLAPLKGLAYMNVYGYNWGLPVPYPEQTTTYDCNEPIINGYLTPAELSKHRIAYSREGGTWRLGGNHLIFPTVRDYADAISLDHCLMNTNGRLYLKSPTNIHPVYVRNWV